MKDKAIIKKCDGEAHGNPYIDNCGICMPFWEYYPLCPKDHAKLNETGYCPLCKKFYDVEDLKKPVVYIVLGYFGYEDTLIREPQVFKSKAGADAFIQTAEQDGDKANYKISEVRLQ
jgi:hypothetical protein